MMTPLIGIVRLMPIHNGIVKAQGKAAPVTRIGNLLYNVLSVGSVDAGVARQLGIEKTESIVMFGGNAEVSHPRSLGNIQPLVRFELHGIPLLRQLLIFGAENVATPLELAGMGKSEIRARVTPLLELVGLAHLADRYPAQISGGQKQRVGIARALASRPKVLLSDEATSALDPETTRSILDLLRQVNRELGLTVVLITHQMQVIKQVADRVAVIEAGRVVEQGRVLDVFTRPQQAITQSLIDEILPQALPASVLDHVRKLARQLDGGRTGQLLRLSYAGESAYQPILSQLIREYGVDMSILHGQVDEIQDETFGSLAVYASGEAERLRGAVAHLRAGGVDVEEVAVAG